MQSSKSFASGSNIRRSTQPAQGSFISVSNTRRACIELAPLGLPLKWPHPTPRGEQVVAAGRLVKAPGFVLMSKRHIERHSLPSSVSGATWRAERAMNSIACADDFRRISDSLNVDRGRRGCPTSPCCLRSCAVLPQAGISIPDNSRWRGHRDESAVPIALRQTRRTELPGQMRPAPFDTSM